jgi:hypothetical protein
MTSQSILTQWTAFGQRKGTILRPVVRDLALDRPAILLPRFVRQSALAMRYHRLLSPIHWSALPERDLARNYGQRAVPYASFVAAYLVKVNQGLAHMSDLRRCLVEHPALCWLLGFPIPARLGRPNSTLADTYLPTQRHLTHILRQIPNAYLQALLDQTVSLVRAALIEACPDFGQSISLDTKHIIAWVKENNPKAYQKRSQRFDKTRQPSGDPDCRLGCKRKHNQRSKSEAPVTPLKDAVPAKGLQVGEYYWGYGSGVVATKVPGWGEFVLAEWTQSFDHSDVSYFFPLMADVERRLGFRPRFGAFDAAFDAWYTYEFFYRDDDEGSFAAVPFSQKGGHKKTFDAQGLPLCAAGIPMPLKFTFWARKGCLVPHEKGRYACPLLFPEPTGQICPIHHKRWTKGGCITTLPTSIGTRIRYQLDRDSELYKQVYRQRTATERINSQATELGIERPKLRNGAAIANLNTLIYVLINLRALQRVWAQKQAKSS